MSKAFVDAFFCGLRYWYLLNTSPENVYLILSTMIFLYYHILENKYPVDTYIHVHKLELDWHILPQFLREYLEYQFLHIDT